MRKSLVAILTAGLLLLGVSPVWAAGQAMAALPAQQGEVVRVVVPEGSELQEFSLYEVYASGPLTFLGGLASFTSGISDVISGARNRDVLQAAAGAVQIVAGWTGMLVGALAPSP